MTFLNQGRPVSGSTMSWSAMTGPVYARRRRSGVQDYDAKYDARSCTCLKTLQQASTRISYLLCGLSCLKSLIIRLVTKNQAL
jgi:hypothetical protein